MGQEDQSENRREQEPTKPVPAVEQAISPGQKNKIEEVHEGPSGKLVMMGRQHIGPLPSPEDLRGYEEVLPGTAEAIVAAFKSETPHRHKIEQKLVDAQTTRDIAEQNYANRGQWMGFVIAVLGIGGGIGLVFTYPTYAGAIGGAGITGLTLAAIVTAFIYGRKSSSSKQSGDQEE